MEKAFFLTRFLIFTQSYAGYRLANYIRKNQYKQKLAVKLGNMLCFEEKDMHYFLFRKSSAKKLSSQIALLSKHNEKITIYLQIEHELIALSKQKDEGDDLVTEDIEKVLLSLAIERVAGNNLSHIETDSWFDKRLIKLIREYRRLYYEVVYMFKLPTMRIIPFLLRIMNV